MIDGTKDPNYQLAEKIIEYAFGMGISSKKTQPGQMIQWYKEQNPNVDLSGLKPEHFVHNELWSKLGADEWRQGAYRDKKYTYDEWFRNRHKLR